MTWLSDQFNGNDSIFDVDIDALIENVLENIKCSFSKLMFVERQLTLLKNLMVFSGRIQSLSRNSLESVNRFVHFALRKKLSAKGLNEYLDIIKICLSNNILYKPQD